MKMNEREFDLRKLFYIESVRMMNTFSAKGIGSLFLASGGAAAALLTYSGHLAALGKETGAYFVPMALFFLSAVLASGAFCLSYIAQFFYAGGAFTGKFPIPGVLFHLLAVLSVIAAYAACLCGMWSVYLIFTGV
jgi:hypothetical protein